MKSDYQSIYDITLKERYDTGITQLNKELADKQDFSFQHIVNKFSESVHEEQSKLRYKGYGEGSHYHSDPYLEELLREFSKRKQLYKQNSISLFIEHQLTTLKSKYWSIQDSLTISALYKANVKQTIVFLARFDALTELQKHVANIEKTANDKSLKTNHSERSEPDSEHSEQAASTARQVLVMHYLFEALNFQRERKRQAKIRLIKMLTGKNEDRIKTILTDPLGYKGQLSSQIKDLEAVRKFFEDLQHEEIVNSINKDFTSLNRKLHLKNDKN